MNDMLSHAGTLGLPSVMKGSVTHSAVTAATYFPTSLLDVLLGTNLCPNVRSSEFMVLVRSFSPATGGV